MKTAITIGIISALFLVALLSQALGQDQYNITGTTLPAPREDSYTIFERERAAINAKLKSDLAKIDAADAAAKIENARLARIEAAAPKIIVIEQPPLSRFEIEQIARRAAGK